MSHPSLSYQASRQRHSVHRSHKLRGVPATDQAIRPACPSCRLGSPPARQVLPAITGREQA